MNNQNNRSASDNVEVLTRLCELVEQAFIDIAPTYAEYMPMAFAIANDCGEAGRSLFHRLCRISHKYNPNNADKIFTDALKGGNGANGIGSVFYLAERAGVDLGDLKRFSPFPYPPSYVFRWSAGAGAQYYNVQNPLKNTFFPRTNNGISPGSDQIEAVSGQFGGFLGKASDATNKGENDTLPYEGQYADLPTHLPSYHWPEFLQRIMDCGEGDAQRDMLFCGSIAALGATMSDFTFVRYSNRKQYPCLQVFVIAPAASGKGAISWIRQLVLPFHKEKVARYEAAKNIYQKELREWMNEGKKRDEALKPEPPKLELFFIAGNNSGTGIQENIIENDGKGIILEPEAEVLSTAIQAEYGQWSHLLRKAHDHEFLSYNRRKDHEYRECDLIRLTVLICGTPAQLPQLIPGAENGLFSRQVFYYMPPLNDFIDMFPSDDDTDYETLFYNWSKRWKKVIDAIQKSVSCIVFQPTKLQRKRLVDCMSQLFHHATVAHGDSMRSSVVRLAVNLLRFMNVVAMIRALDSLLSIEEEELEVKLRNVTAMLLECPGITPANNIPLENVKDGIITKFHLEVNNEDFDALLNLAEPFYRHAEHALKAMPKELLGSRNMTPKEKFLGALPMKFTRQEAMELAREYELTEKQCEHFIDKLVANGTLERCGRGTYSFIGDKKILPDEPSPQNEQS